MIIRKGTIFTIIAINFIAVVLTLFLFEAYLSITDKPGIHKWGWHYRGTDRTNVNEFGFRGQPTNYYERSDFVIVLVGDSQVEAERCSFEKMPERRLEHHLSGLTNKPIKVFSLGAGGYGQDQQLLALTQFFSKHSADLVIVWETPGNDVWNNMFPTHWPKDGWPKPTFWLDNTGQLQGPQTQYSRFRTLSLIYHRLFRLSLDELWEKKYLPPAYKSLANYSGKVSRDWYVMNMKYENLQNEKTHVGISLAPVSERTKYGLRLTNKLLKKMKWLSEDNGAEFATFFIDRPDVTLPDGVYALDRDSRTLFVRISKDQYRKNLDEINDGLQFFSIPVFVEKVKKGEDAHLNEDGVDRAMKELATVLSRQIIK